MLSELSAAAVQNVQVCVAHESLTRISTQQYEQAAATAIQAIVYGYIARRRVARTRAETVKGRGGDDASPEADAATAGSPLPKQLRKSLQRVKATTPVDPTRTRSAGKQKAVQIAPASAGAETAEEKGAGKDADDARGGARGGDAGRAAKDVSSASATFALGGNPSTSLAVPMASPDRMLGPETMWPIPPASPDLPLRTTTPPPARGVRPAIHPTPPTRTQPAPAASVFTTETSFLSPPRPPAPALMAASTSERKPQEVSMLQSAAATAAAARATEEVALRAFEDAALRVWMRLQLKRAMTLWVEYSGRQLLGLAIQADGEGPCHYF